MKKLQLAVFLVLAIIINGCGSTTRITSTWKAAGISADNYHKVMVLGIIREADRNVRIQMENRLLTGLKDLGYNAFSAYQVYGPQMFQNTSEQEANKQLAGDGVDAVLTVVLLDKQRERYYAPGRVVYSPYVIYQNRVWGYYRMLYTRIDEPDYYQESTRYFWESNLYDLKTNQLLFSVQTQSFDPSSVDELAKDYGQKIISTMVQNNVLQKQQIQAAKAM